MRGSKNPNPTALEIARRDAKLSRKKLEELSGVSYRTIQGYEQRQKNINVASIKTIKALSQAIGCQIEKILEEEE